MATEKTCFKCLQSKPLAEFYKHTMMGDGHLNKCKECTKKDVAAHRQANLERVRQYDRMRANLPHRLQMNRENSTKYRQEFPHIKRAQAKVRAALRAGKVKKAPCFVCGDTRVEAHHPDYSAPLDVVWLCPPHHRQLHAEAA